MKQINSIINQMEKHKKHQQIEHSYNVLHFTDWAYVPVYLTRLLLS